MDKIEPIFVPSSGGALRQGEILSGLVQIIPKSGTSIGDPDNISVDVKKFAFAIIISQDCDLNSDHINRIKIAKEQDAGKLKALQLKALQNVLLCEVESAKAQKTTFLAQLSAWERIVKNDDFRYHLLQAVKSEEDAKKEGIEPLIIAFKRYFTIPTADLLKRIELAETHRRCYMQSPYFEHVSDRFTHYHGRVGLPLDHDISGLK